MPPNARGGEVDEGCDGVLAADVAAGRQGLGHRRR